VPILFDTGALELLRRRHREAEKLAIDFFPPLVSVHVLGEFLYGQLLAGVSSNNLLQAQNFLAGFDVQQPDSSTASVYARLRADLKRRGIVLPDPDYWIGAHAVQMNWPVASTDTDFKHFDEIRLFLLSFSQMGEYGPRIAEPKLTDRDGENAEAESSLDCARDCRGAASGIRACFEIGRGPAARDFGRGRGGEAGASPQRAVTAEPTKAAAKRPAALRVFGEKAFWLRCFSLTDRQRVCSLVACLRAPHRQAPRQNAFSAKTGPRRISKQALIGFVPKLAKCSAP